MKRRGCVPVKTQDLAENENQHHADKDARLLHVGADARVAHDADAVAGRETGQADGQAAGEVHEAAGQVSTRRCLCFHSSGRWPCRLWTYVKRL